MQGLARGEKPQREVFTGHQVCEVLILFAERFSHELRSETITHSRVRKLCERPPLYTEKRVWK